MVHLLLEWRPALADQVDSSGSSPLHFASSDGDRTIVNAILRASPPSTVYRKDSSGLSALHVAARMGHHRVVEDMLGICPDAAELRDGNGGTFVHAAAREKRSSVVSLATKNPMLRGLLDAQDREGNTPLHLAVAAGSTGIVEDMLHNGKVRANVLNNDGHTAFDLAAGSTTSFFKMVSLVVALVAYGAQLRPQRQDQLKQWGGRDMVRKGIQNTSDSLAVVAGLIVAAAFAAGFNLPGGYGDDGKANLKDETVFKSFLVLNTGAVATSVVAVILLVYGKASHSAGSWKSFAAALHLLWLSLVFMMLAFQAALFSVATTRALNYGFVAVYTCIFVLQACIAEWLGPATRLRTIWRFHWKGRRHVDVKRQYPFAKATVLNLQLFTATSFLGSLCFQVFFVLSRRSMGTSIAPSPSALY
jgi:ankyrin repeat protein